MFGNILVPMDLDEPASSTDALSTAIRLANCFSSRLTLCSVVRDVEAIGTGQWLPLTYEQLLFEARARLNAVASKLDTQATVRVEVGTGTISGGILNVADRIAADLIVLGSHKPNLGDPVFSANAARVARRATCSVLVVRSARGTGATVAASANERVEAP